MVHDGQSGEQMPASVHIAVIIIMCSSSSRL